MKRVLVGIMFVGVALVGPSTGSGQAEGAQVTPAPAPQVRTVRESLDSISREIERPKTRPTDPGPVGGGGGINGPLGRTCKEARERMRWSDLPCSPFMQAE